MSTTLNIQLAPPRPLPVILLLDTSGSMQPDGKIDALNLAVKNMVESFQTEADGKTEISITIITFGGSATLVTPPMPVRDFKPSPLTANGSTPMGAALTIVTQLLEDRNQLPSRAYTPTVVLVSDGMPNDAWQEPLATFLGSSRGNKAQKFALAIGADADHDVLKLFLNNPEGRVFEAHEARDIQKFFQWVTLSVTTRSRSVSPNTPVDITPLALDNYPDY